MQTNLDSVKFLCGNCKELEKILSKTVRVTTRQPFAPIVEAFLDRVSSILLRNKEVIGFPDIVTFAFFCRKANIRKLSEQYSALDMKKRLGRGLIFHVAPSNVPINFAYTLVMGLLAGNACIVKVSSKDFAQTQIVSNVFSQLLQENEFIALDGSVNVIEYARDQQELTELFSSICNVRVIWGGDKTIHEVRKANLPPRAFDITFADRYSFAVFSADAIMAISQDQKKIEALAHGFFNDTYLYDQNACSSPRLICWIGKEKKAKEAQKVFWQAVYDNIYERYSVEPVVAVDKLLAVCRTSIAAPFARLEKTQDNRIVRINMPSLSEQLPDWRSPGGLFHEYLTETIEDFPDFIDEKYQTLSYFGLDPENLQKTIIKKGMLGIDRIVPIGKTAEMGLVWDGYDLIRTMSRIVALS